MYWRVDTYLVWSWLKQQKRRHPLKMFQPFRLLLITIIHVISATGCWHVVCFTSHLSASGHLVTVRILCEPREYMKFYLHYCVTQCSKRRMSVLLSLYSPGWGQVLLYRMCFVCERHKTDKSVCLYESSQVCMIYFSLKTSLQTLLHFAQSY